MAEAGMVAYGAVAGGWILFTAIDAQFETDTATWT